MCFLKSLIQKILYAASNVVVITREKMYSIYLTVSFVSSQHNLWLLYCINLHTAKHNYAVVFYLFY